MSRLGTAALALALLSACGGAHEYTGIGRVIAADPARLEVTLDHEDIPGFMGAMTMRFSVASPDVLSGVSPGTRVRFRLRVERGGPVVISLSPLG